MAVFHQNVILPFCFILQIPQTTVDTIINQENDPVSMADIGRSITGSFEV